MKEEVGCWVVSGGQGAVSRSLSIPGIPAGPCPPGGFQLGLGHGNNHGEDKGKKCGQTNDTFGCEFEKL